MKRRGIQDPSCMADQVEPTNPLAGLSVLIVEDEPLLAFELFDELERLNAFPMGPIASVDAALAAIDSGQQIDAAIINVFLRGAVSFPVADALVARGIPFLFVTGDDAFVRQHFPNVPCEPKPADMWKIVQSLKLLLQ